MTAICGTDLHPYRGEIGGFRADTVMGHEFVGVVEAVGGEVPAALGPGTRVVASDVIACGRCWWCRQGYHYQCPHVALFGYGEVVGDYVAGGQAEAVRVPFADTVLAPLPDDIADEAALFVGDILATGWTAAVDGGVAGGELVAVVGCGPVGLCAAMSATARGAATIVGVDPLPARRQAAAELGILAVAPSDALAAVRDPSGGRGADVVIEAVGTSPALAGALDLGRARGVVVSVGAHHATFPLDTADAFARELTLRFAVGDPIRYAADLLGLVRAGVLDATRVVSHRLSLDDAALAYELFDRGEATKVVLTPSGNTGGSAR
jgi:threonine dehydrogenase-like Zn-dependent dehydrogenase